MPPRTRPISPEEEAQRELDDELTQAIAEIAAEMGPAPGAKHVSEAQKLAMWGQRDPQVDYDQMLEMLQTTGIAPELLDPKSEQALMIVQENPEIAEMYAGPVEPALAEALAVLAEHPFRLSVISSLVDDPEAYVAEADRLDAKWQKQFGAVAPSVAPVPYAAPVAPPVVMPEPAAPPQTPMSVPAMPPVLPSMVGG